MNYANSKLDPAPRPAAQRFRDFMHTHVFFMRLVLFGAAAMLSIAIAEVALRATWFNPHIPRVIGADYAD